VMPRFQQPADGRYLRRFIGDEMDKHFKAEWEKLKPWPSTLKRS